MPCQVLCDGFIRPYVPACSQVTINCSREASCDVIFSRRGGFETAIDCKNTTHSCSVICDSLSYVSFFECNNSTSCNCGASCDVSHCFPGFKYAMMLSKFSPFERLTRSWFLLQLHRRCMFSKSELQVHRWLERWFDDSVRGGQRNVQLPLFESQLRNQRCRTRIRSKMRGSEQYLRIR
jgi:hypothetical protein